MSKETDIDYVKESRQKGGKSRKKKTYNESFDYQTQRHQKISFKKYIEELEEDLEDDEEDYSRYIK